MIAKLMYLGAALWVALVLALCAYGVLAPSGHAMLIAQAPPCAQINAHKWDRLVKRERAADGHSRRLRATPVCVRTYKHFKRHVIKVERGPCFKKGVKCWIIFAADKYHQPVGDALRVAYCESSDNPREVNNEPVAGEYATGLFQFLPSTWATTPYARKDILDPHWNALAAMWMWAHGRRGEWACQ